MARAGGLVWAARHDNINRFHTHRGKANCPRPGGGRSRSSKKSRFRIQFAAALNGRAPDKPKGGRTACSGFFFLTAQARGTDPPPAFDATAAGNILDEQDRHRTFASPWDSCGAQGPFAGASGRARQTHPSPHPDARKLAPSPCMVLRISSSGPKARTWADPLLHAKVQVGFKIQD
jgi:hypothetical protein